MKRIVIQRGRLRGLPRLRFDNRQCRRDLSKVGGVTCDDSLETSREGGDQDVRYWTLRNSEGPSMQLMFVPQTMCHFCVENGPWFGGCDRYGLEKGSGYAWSATEGRPKFDECYGTNTQALSQMFLKTRRRCRSPRRIGQQQIQNHRGTDYPSHLVAFSPPQIQHRFLGCCPGRGGQRSACSVDLCHEFGKRGDLNRFTRFIANRHANPLAFWKTLQQFRNHPGTVVSHVDRSVDRAHGRHSTLTPSL